MAADLASEKSFVNRGVAFLAPAVQRRGINSFAPKHGADAAVPGGAFDVLRIRFLSSALNLRRCALAGTSGSGELAAKGIAVLASLTMILLAALLCNYGRGFCLIDIGTEGNRTRYRETVRSEISNPSFNSSPCMRGAPQVGFSLAMVWREVRTSGPVTGLPTSLLRERKRQ